MGILKNIKTRIARWLASGLANSAQWLNDWVWGGSSNDSGINVTRKSALEYAPIWHGVTKIAGHVGQIPCNLLEEVDERTKKQAYRHPAYRLMKSAPNDLMAADVFRETLQAHALLQGNGRAYIERNLRNDPIALIPLLPDRTVTVLIGNENTGEYVKWHVVRSETTGKTYKIEDYDVLHIMGLGYDGIQGYSLIEFARNSLGLGLAAEKASSRQFKNGGMPGMILQAPAGVFADAKDAAQFLKDFNDYHAGVDNAGKVGLLREGIQAQPLQMSGRDSQWIEQRKFQRQEAALWLQLEQILGDDSSVSYNSLEMKNLAYLANCLNRWLIRWEGELNRKLLTGLQQRTYSHCFKFNRNALLQATTKERFDVYSLAIPLKIMNPNECREKEDLPPYEGGDVYENPNITPTQPASTAADETATDDDVDAGGGNSGDDTYQRLQMVIASRIQEVIQVETHRVIEAAGKQKNFVTWLDEFYSENGFVPRLLAVWQQCGGTLEQMLAYANESKAMLLDMAGRVGTQAELAAAVANLTAKWNERGTVQAGLILELSKLKQSQAA